MNGWLRLWIVLSVIWGLVVGALALVQYEPQDGDYAKMYGVFFAVWAVPVFGLIAVGYALKWVGAGFKAGQ